METIGIVEVQCLTLADVQVQFRQKFDEDRKKFPGWQTCSSRAADLHASDAATMLPPPSLQHDLCVVGCCCIEFPTFG